MEQSMVTFELAWRDTHVCINNDGDTAKAFIFAGCIMLRMKLPAFPFFKLIFFSPDGKKFDEEIRLIEYMDRKTKVTK